MFVNKNSQTNLAACASKYLDLIHKILKDDVAYMMSDILLDSVQLSTTATEAIDGSRPFVKFVLERLVLLHYLRERDRERDDVISNRH